ncbi:uncharacterized protein K452DRAFT_276522 [Aplosporella prunicola CBS 121167]|uniref:Heterokaryon incompatibility domain-containing protein n=1 Tax=Aplosporella prunicola CBS 121167 TaxID=1176127 RepID=A0A6A6B704_9PEZI|nr:uncharacterized protein K452DRAFT_276522 [Aplosporella prunicola CBS 121167]KAF2138767.1 hypothetical protein K452DRAFT_276522 [Aplosporella prunicola CBS 121167]
MGDRRTTAGPPPTPLKACAIQGRVKGFFITTATDHLGKLQDFGNNHGLPRCFSWKIHDTRTYLRSKIPDLCNRCNNLALLSHESIRKEAGSNFMGERSLNRSLILHPLFKELKETARAGCLFCSILVDLPNQAQPQPYNRGSTQYGGSVIVIGDNIPVSFYPVSATYPNEVLCSFVISRRQGSTNLSDWPILGSEAEISAHTGDGVCYQFLEQCLRNCLQRVGSKGHRSCTPFISTSLPKRVIDLSRGINSLKVLEASNRTDKYVTLSYCWGNEGLPLRLFTQNYKQMKEKLPWQLLPAVFQNAVEVCLRLGVGFLWIDALCIIQDDSEDWEIESSKMAQYFQGAFFTIAASSSRNCFEPFLRPRDPRWLHREFQGQSNRLTQSIRVRQIEEIPDITLHDPLRPLSSRGWCFQEYVLSSRIMHFYNSELMWECKSYKFFESGSERFTSLGFIPLTDLNRFTGAINDLKAWGRVVSAYTKRKLTRPSDRLPALSGLASFIQAATGATYLAGMWRQTLIGSLLWSSEISSYEDQDWSPMAEDDRTPSWSWASINGPISFLTPEQPNISILDIHCSPKGSNPFGQVKGGYIILEGNIMIANLNGSNGRKICRLFAGISLLGAHYLHLDRPVEECDCRTPIFAATKTLRRVRGEHALRNDGKEFNACVELLRFATSGSFAFFLILGRSDTIHGAHVRLGLVWFRKHMTNDFLSVGRRRVTII